MQFESASSAGYEERTRAFFESARRLRLFLYLLYYSAGTWKKQKCWQRWTLSTSTRAVEYGYKEVVLTGVNVGDYGRNDGTNLLTLLKPLVHVDGLIRIRISSIEPNLLTDELLDFCLPKINFATTAYSIAIGVRYNSPRNAKKIFNRSVYRSRGTNHISYTICRYWHRYHCRFPGESNELFEETYSYLFTFLLLISMCLVYFRKAKYSGIRSCQRNRTAH